VGTSDDPSSEADESFDFDVEWASIRAHLFWLLFALPGLYQLQKLLRTFAARFGYGYDLEWMEGGMLVHAYRMVRGLPIYRAPSLDFIPYLYTPLYPAVLAVIGSVTGIDYQLGRAVSIGAFGVVAALAIAAPLREADPERRPVALAGACLAIGGMAAAYPWTEGWYDIARSDTMLCAMLAVGAFGLRTALDAPNRADTFWRPDVAAWAAVLGLAFFVKQTAVIFVAGGGLAVLLFRWRALPAYVVTAGIVGLGGTLILNVATDGWFWRYIFEYHQRHPTSPELFWKAFGAIWNHLPVATSILGASLLASAAARLSGRVEHASIDGTLFWVVMTATATLAAATGRTTRWAGFNGYMPLIFIGHIATAVGLVALERVARAWSRSLGWVVATAALTIFGMHLLDHQWETSTYVPSSADRKAGDRLLERLRALDGPIFSPSFPWYARLAGSEPTTHRMGIKDTTRLSPARCTDKKRREQLICPELPPEARQVAGLPERLREGEFGAVLMGYRDRRLYRHMSKYRFVETYGPNQRPSQPTGYSMGLLGLWERERPRRLPDHGEMLFDFESSQLPEWELTGDAWGDGPVTSTLPRQQPVGGYGGDRFMNSYHGGDAGEGVATSPTFTLDKPYMHLQVGGGGKQRKRVRVALRSDEGDVLRTASGRNSEVMRSVRWNVEPFVGQQVHLVLVDESSDGWGHLTVDDVWIGDK
jgi:hypothetical protein